MRTLSFIMTAQQEGKKIYDILKLEYGVSTTVIKALKRVENGITLDGVHARVIDKVKAGQELKLNLRSPQRQMEECNRSVPICYEDEDFIIFNKPPHMPVHPSHDHQEETLANVWAAYMRRKVGYIPVFHPVNRLDKDTSGLVLCAKNTLCASLDPRKVEKKYTAVVTGVLEGKGIIDAPIGREEGSKMRRTIRLDGQEARTFYECLCNNDEYTLVEFRLETGRTHQIRVHMSYLGHPLAGDDLYGGSRKDIGRQALHCGQMEFLHPVTHQQVEVTADLDEEMQKLVDEVFEYSQYE